MSWEISNRCTVRSCRRIPETTPRGRGSCRFYKNHRPKTKMVQELWDEQPRELMELLARAKMSVQVGDKGKVRVRR